MGVCYALLSCIYFEGGDGTTARELANDDVLQVAKVTSKWTWIAHLFNSRLQARKYGR